MSLLVSLGLHMVVLLAALLGPAVAARSSKPIEYVSVEIVPARALGVPRPAQTERPRPPAPPREEKKEEPKPAETKTQEPQAPVLPAKEEKKKSPAKPPSGREEKEAQAPSPPAAEPVVRQGSPQGSPLGTSAFGAEVAGLGDPDFTYGYYVDQMLALIESNWVRPPLGGEVKAVLHFRIHKEGRVTDLRIVESSGYSSFDLAALRAVQYSSPLPPLPRTYRHDSLGVTLIVR